MTRAVSVAEAKNDLPALVHEAEQHPIAIERRGKRVAMLVSAKEYDRLTGNGDDPWKALERFRARHDLEALDLGDVFEGVRDRRPGRSVRW